MVNLPGSSEPHLKQGLSFELQQLKKHLNKERISLGELLSFLGDNSHVLLAIVFAIPFLLPVPIPGLSIAFGLVIAFAGGAMALAKPPWLPKFLLKREFSSALLIKILDKAIRLSRFMEKIVKPRGTLFIRHPGIRRINGFMIAICGALLALPLPPGTNLPPAAAIFLLCLSTLEDDVVILLLGCVAFVVNAVFFIELALYGTKGVQFFLH